MLVRVRCSLVNEAVPVPVMFGVSAGLFRPLRVPVMGRFSRSILVKTCVTHIGFASFGVFKHMCRLWFGSILLLLPLSIGPGCGMLFAVLPGLGLPFQRGGCLATVFWKRTLSHSHLAHRLRKLRAVCSCPLRPTFGLLQHERRWLSERRQVATARRVQDPNLIFRDLRAPAARPVDSLLEHRSAEVGEVVVDEGALELTEQVDWHPDFPLLHKGQPLHVAHVESDKIWVDLPEDCAPGDRIDQPVLLGSLPDVFRVCSQAS